jgi:hypothetical protein
MREPPVRTEPHPTRRTSQTFLNFVPFGTDNDFNRPSGTKTILPSKRPHQVSAYGAETLGYVPQAPSLGPPKTFLNSSTSRYLDMIPLPSVRLGLPCQRPTMIATLYLLFRGQDTSASLECSLTSGILDLNMLKTEP